MSTVISAAQAALQRALKMMNSRISVTLAHVGKVITLQITNEPTIVPVKDKNGDAVLDSEGQPLMKAIINFKANSQVAKSNERNKEILKGALAAYQAEDIETADAAMRDFLNKVQVSGNVILRQGQQCPFSKGQTVEGTVSLVTTDNGSLLTIEGLYAPKPTAAAKESIESFESLLGEEAADDLSREL